jgi:hypothetical protein
MTIIRQRRPTAEEAAFVGRENYGGDSIIETQSVREAQAMLAEAFELLGMCDVAHVLSAGVYLEE